MTPKIISLPSVSAVAVALTLGVSSAAGAPTAQGGDQWVGLISYSWESPMPEDSPLKKQIQTVDSWWEEKWRLGVVLKRVRSAGQEQRYACTQGNLGYRRRLWTRAKEEEGGKWMKVFSDDLTSTENTRLTARQCTLTLIVDRRSGTYRVEGWFEAEGATRKGVVTIEIKDENGTRTMSQPIDSTDDIDQGCWFSGKLPGAAPSRLDGHSDLSEAAFGGLEYWAEDVGGVVSWRLYRSGCASAQRRCLEDLGRDLSRCFAEAQSGKDIKCNEAELNRCHERGEWPQYPKAGDKLELVPLPGTPEPEPSSRECAESSCTTSGDVSAREFQKALDRIAECIDAYRIKGTDCMTMCR